MQKTVIWINIKASKTGRLFLVLAYAGVIFTVICYNYLLASWLVPLILLQGWWSWRLAFGVAAPLALLLKEKKLYLQLASGQLQYLKPPLLVHSRYCLVFKPSGLFSWPWLLWPDAISTTEHQQLRYFLRGWH